MKAKQIKMYSFGRSCIKDGIIASENLEDNIVTLTESFLTMALACYKETDLQDGQLIEEIILAGTAPGGHRSGKVPGTFVILENSTILSNSSFGVLLTFHNGRYRTQSPKIINQQSIKAADLLFSLTVNAKLVF